MTYPEALTELIEEFQEVEDKMERLEMVFELSEEVELFRLKLCILRSTRHSGVPDPGELFGVLVPTSTSTGTSEELFRLPRLRFCSRTTAHTMKLRPVTIAKTRKNTKAD